ncbi:MAG: twin-arginine translocase TatA/TatE family subunit [Flavobacteriaceae bacterium]|jgi:TatA/E family protein of Tat protein translocase|nr:twin-arginine translocase TatA/TatE family subunit [Flavobacteriaceae bacterium]
MNFSVVLPAFISFEELTLILLISVLIFGPKKIPEVARGLGEGLRAMKKATDDIKREIMTPVDEINPMKDIEETIQKTQEEIKDSITDIPDPQKEIEETLDDMVGPIKRK